MSTIPIGPCALVVQELYRLSEQTLGFDFCNKNFEDGMYTFHDTFEYWGNSTSFHSNILKSAQWEEIINGTYYHWGTVRRLGVGRKGIVVYRC
jgi:hypothetical protein